MTQFYQLIRSHINELDAGTGVGTDKNKLNVLETEGPLFCLVGGQKKRAGTIVARLNRRFGALVGLEVGACKPLQVLYIPTGGYITPHYDWGCVSTLPLLSFLA